MFRQYFAPGEHGLGTTHDGRLYPTGQPEPEWLRRRYEQAEALRELAAREPMRRTTRRSRVSELFRAVFRLGTL